MYRRVLPAFLANYRAFGFLVGPEWVLNAELSASNGRVGDGATTIKLNRKRNCGKKRPEQNAKVQNPDSSCAAAPRCGDLSSSPCR